jgi:hypothetical protein
VAPCLDCAGEKSSPVWIRITQPSDGELDGVPLKSSAVGVSYNVSPELASYLIATNDAEPVEEGEPDKDVAIFGSDIGELTIVQTESRTSSRVSVAGPALQLQNPPGRPSRAPRLNASSRP